MSKPDEQTVLDHPHDGIETVRERFRVCNALACGVDNLVPAIRDKSVTVRAPP